MSEELKPCPFCGGNASVHNSNFAVRLYYVKCDLCEIGTQYYNHPDDAVDAWNQRVNEDVEQEV